MVRETLLQLLPDIILGFFCRARNSLTRIVGYLKKVMTKLWIKIHMKFDSEIESGVAYGAAPYTDCG